jgi:hypothetical protein
MSRHFAFVSGLGNEKIVSDAMILRHIVTLR